MRLRASLQSLSLVAVRGLPAQPEITRLLNRPGFLNARAVERPRIDLHEVSRRLIAAIERGLAPDRLDWRHAPWCLWTAKPALVDHDGAFRRLLSSSTQQKSAYRRLASVYLAEYEPGRHRIEEVGRVLAAGAEAAGDPWRR
jgi:hypothetical protein